MWTSTVRSSTYDVVAPDFIQQLCTAVHAAAVRHEEAQHAEFEGAQLDVLAAARDAARGGIEAQARDLDDHVRVLRRAAAHDGLDAREELARARRA
jgi:hypothetical protein